MEDDAGLRRLVQRALERRGFTIALAGDAEEGLAMLRTEPFELVAIDQNMPGKSGREMLDDILAMPDHPAVVFVTGNDDTSVAVEAIQAGASDFVVKTVGEGFFDLLANRFHAAFERSRLLRDKQAAEAELRAANERLEMLVREVHHRVSNSLQMVLSFVSMQAGQTADPSAREALQATQNRIRAISKVHHRLYTRDDLTTIDLDDYLGTLVDELRASMVARDRLVTLDLRADPVLVSPDEAVSIGVIVNELVSNAAKYAFADGMGGSITIELAGHEGGYTLSVVDDGTGFDSSAPATGTGMGMRIVNAVTRSLDSQLETLAQPKGSAFRLAVKRGRAA